MARYRRSLSIASLTLLSAGVLGAQIPGLWGDGPQRPGFAGSLGVGAGSATTEIQGNFGTNGAPAEARLSSSAMTYDLFLGFGLNPRWRLGAEVELIPGGYSSTYSSAVGSVGTSVYYTVGVVFFPSASLNLWCKANVGYGTLDFHAPGGVTISGGGLAAGLGLGYDWRVGDRGMFMLPFVNYIAQLSNTSLTGDVTPWSGRAGLLQAGVGIGYNP